MTPQTVWTDHFESEGDAMNRFQNILCVVSATQGDTSVVERAVGLAEHNQARLTLVGVVPRVTAGIGMPDGSSSMEIAYRHVKHRNSSDQPAKCRHVEIARGS
jgi:hypothetical protein